MRLPFAFLAMAERGIIGYREFPEMGAKLILKRQALRLFVQRCDHLDGNLVALLGQIPQAGGQALFGNRANGRSRDAQGNPAVFFFVPETLALQVRIELAAGFPVGVGNVVSRDGLLAREFTNACHDRDYWWSVGMLVYPSPFGHRKQSPWRANGKYPLYWGVMQFEKALFPACFDWVSSW